MVTHQIGVPSLLKTQEAGSAACSEPFTPVEATLRGRAIEQWMANTSSQLTYFGLEQIIAHMHERQLACLFRNNHFSTILKLGGSVFALVTDDGYRLENEVVWERLDLIDGDTEYVNAQHRTPIIPLSTVPTALRMHEGTDALLAMQLQSEPSPFFRAETREPLFADSTAVDSQVLQQQLDDKHYAQLLQQQLYRDDSRGGLPSRQQQPRRALRADRTEKREGSGCILH